MARNRVGVVADSDVVAPDADQEQRPLEEENREAAALERKKQKKQRELLRKKKAERRANARQRKEAQATVEDENPAVPDHVHAVGDQEEPSSIELQDERVQTNAEPANHRHELLPRDDARQHILEATNDSAAIKPRLNGEIEPTTVLKGPAGPPPALPPLHVNENEDGDDAIAAPESVPRSGAPSPARESTISDHRQVGQQESSVSLPSEAATLSVEETEVTLRPKKVKRHKRDPADTKHDDSDGDHVVVAAAKTIQKAMKKSLLKKTKRSLQKAKSFIRHSSKVLAVESNPIEPPASARPVFVPPLALKPRSPPPSSSESSASEDDEEIGAPPLGGASPARTVSRPHSSSGSSCSSSCSSRTSSSASEPSPVKSKKRGRYALPVKGPSVEMLRLPQMAREYGELHHLMAVRIQARVRGMRGRKIVRQREIEFEREIRAEALREVQEEASVRIQAHIKGFLERRRLGIDGSLPDHYRKGKRKHQKRPHAKPNSVVPQCMVDGTLGTEAESEENKVAEWPEELNLEPEDEWTELNSIATPQGDSVTTAQFLSRGKLRVFCGTWNLHAKKPTDDLRLWIPPNKYHVVAVGTEECVHSIAKSVVFTSKKQWEDQLKETLGDEYVLVAAHSLTAIHNVVFVHESVLPYVHGIQSDAVATGLGNQLGNKGGVGIAFMVGHTSLAFVNCHFDAHQQNVAKRNANFHRINQELHLAPAAANIPVPAGSPTPVAGLGKTTMSRFSSSRAGSSSALNGTTASRTSVSGGGSPVVRRRKLPVSESFDRVFWYGDLNYRINGTRRMIDLLLLHNHHAVLRFNDQLRIEMAKGSVFPHFQEGPLHFRPTYKFDKHSNVYDSGPKQRIPSWTDRILYLSNEKPQDIELLSYRSHMNFQTSDHRPVGAVFQVSFTRDGVQATNEPAPDNSGAGKGVADGEGGGAAGGEAAGSGGPEAQAFARVMAKGYKPNQTRSEVCVVQ